MKRVEKYCDLYLVPIIIFFYDNKNTSDLLLLKNFGESKEDLSEIAGWVEPDLQMYFNLGCATENRVPGMIAHEALHFTLRMFNQKGIFLKSKMINKCDQAYDEPWAYFLTYLVNLIHSEYEIYKTEIK